MEMGGLNVQNSAGSVYGRAWYCYTNFVIYISILEVGGPQSVKFVC